MALIAAHPAMADGGAGGTGANGTGGAGGATSLSGAGGAGGASSVQGTNTTSGGGGAGGGAGVTGGAGGKGASTLLGQGGAGGATPGANGANGTNGGTHGAGGGGGGAHGSVGASPSGGTGGNGGNGGASTGGGGGGGAGGYGAIATTSSMTMYHGLDFTGGRGGNGGGSRGGSGGDGGLGIQFTGTANTITLGGAITGGAGGNPGGGTGSTAGIGGIGVDLGAGNNLVVGGTVTGGNGGNGTGGGAGGAGIRASNARITLETGALVAGGMSGAGVQANAVTFTGSTNRFELQGGVTVTGNVVASGTSDFVFSGATNGTIDGTQYQGFSSFEKTGTSRLTMTGTSGITGPVLVAAGTLVVDGSIASASGVTVAAGATIGGSGTLSSTTVSGTISPGNSAGTLTVAGNLTMNAGSTYVAEVLGASADRIDVVAGNGQAGIANLAGTLRIVPLGGSYTFGNPYTLLSAAGGRAGTFTTVDTAGSFGAGVTSAVSYSANDVRLTLTAAPLAPVVTTPTAPQLPTASPININRITSALDAFVAAGGDVSPLFNLYNQPASVIASSVNQLSGEAHTGSTAVGSTVTNQFLGTALDSSLPGRLSNAQPGPGGAAAFTGSVSKGHDVPAKPSFLDEPRFALWGATSGSVGSVDGEARTGSAKQNLDDAHLAIGADVRVLPGTIVGVAVSAGKARSSLSGGLGKVETDVFQTSLYGMTRIGALNLSAAAGYGRLDNDGTRNVPVLGNALTSSYVSTVWSGRVQASAAIASWSGVRFSPLAALQAVQVRSPSFTEQASFGGNAGALTVARRWDNTSRSELGLLVDAQTAFGAVPVTAFVRAAWAHYFARNAAMTASMAALPGVSFSTVGARPDRDSALIAAGLDAKLSERISLGIRLDSELSANARSLGGTAQLRGSF